MTIDPPRLSAEARARMAAAAGELAALAALGRLAELIDPRDALPRWTIAGTIAGRLRRFEAVAYPRIAAGARPPRDESEELLAMICGSALPRSQRKLYALLQTDARGQSARSILGAH